ncbi:hypothetical protein AGMMS49587_11810 [Spirochaetia bacterium]|nr:hypothetical protein AGMMS49587_11810 [Spirochaetia bacterium]
MRINVPDFPGPVSPGISGFVKSSGAGVKTGSPNQARPSPQLLTTPSSLLTGLGLPGDKLSASIVAFARFFSLPLEGALLTKIRRQSLSPDTGIAAPANSPNGEQTAAPGAASADKALSLKFREALSLAAAAAADKGVELSRDSLADYARSLSRQPAIDPDKGRSGGDGHGNNGGFGAGADSGNNADGETGGSTGGTGGGSENGSPNKGRDRDRKPGDAEALRDKILRAAEQNTLISLMNRLSGKKGQRWVVFPFSFEDQGRNFAVTLRILLTAKTATGNSGFQAERMALEIAGENRRPNKDPARWLFVVENPPNGKLRLNGSFWPGAEKTSGRVLRSLEKELAGLLGLAPEQVQMREDEEFPPFAPDSRDETSFSLNEEA